MAIRFRRGGGDIDRPVKFDFSQYKAVYRYAVGISYWSFTCLDDKGHPAERSVEKIEVSCSSRQLDRTIETTVSAVLSNQSGSIIKLGDASVDLCCAAVVDLQGPNAPDPHVGMGNPAYGVPDDHDSSPFDLPDANLLTGIGFLSGFHLAYGDGEHYVQQINALAGFHHEGINGMITARAGMADARSHSATTATIDGGYIATSSNEDMLLCKAVYLQKPDDTVPVDFETPIVQDFWGAVGVFIADFKMTFGSGNDHLIHQISCGVYGYERQGTTTVMLNGPGVRMVDYSSHSVEPSQSGVNLIVMAIKDKKPPVGE